MTNLTLIQKKLSNHLLTSKEQLCLKGKGIGNMHRKPGKNCPPPIENGKKQPKVK